MSATHPAYRRGPLLKARAEHAIAFIRGLTLSTDGLRPWAGMPFDLQSWQTAIVRELFGRVRADDRTRRAYRTAFLGLPRKQGKSELAAAFALYGLIGEGIRRGQVYSAANEKEQAAQVFNAAVAMVENDPELRRRIDIKYTNKRMIDRETGTFYQAISAEAYSKHGYNPHLVIYDELHAAQNSDLWNVLRTAMGARREPLIVAITTAGFDRTTICYELWEYARKVRDGIIDDPAFYQCLYEAPADADWQDEKVWRAVNPALGTFRDIEEMRDLAREARNRPAARQTFRRLYLNQWTEGETQWLDVEAWANCLTRDVAAAQGLRTYAGLDLGLKSDLSALVGVTPLPDGTVYVRVQIWMPEGARSRFYERPYAAWEEADAITITPGPVSDFARILADTERLCAEWGCVELAYDERFAAGFIQQLEPRMPEVDLIQQPQGFALNVGLRDLEDRVLAGTLIHNNQPVLAWMASNAVAEISNGGAIAVVKKKNREKIDAIVALAMALQRAALHEGEGAGGSPWEDPAYGMEAATW